MYVVARMNLKLHQFDIETTFLNRELKEDIYKVKLKGFQIEGLEEKLYKLIRSLYILKQPSRQWYLKFHKDILEIV